MQRDREEPLAPPSVRATLLREFVITFYFPCRFCLLCLQLVLHCRNVSPTATVDDVIDAFVRLYHVTCVMILPTPGQVNLSSLGF